MEFSLHFITFFTLQNPMGQINMRDTRVEEVEHISDSDSEENSQTVEKSALQPTLGIFPNHVHQGPTYLIFPSRADQEKWLYQLTLVSGEHPQQYHSFTAEILIPPINCTI